MQRRARDRDGELGEEGREERGRAAVGDEEDRLREDGGGRFGVERGLASGAFVRVSGAFGGGWGGAGVEGRGVGEGAEVCEEVDEVDFADLGGDEDVFLGQAGGGRDSGKRRRDQLHEEI